MEFAYFFLMIALLVIGFWTKLKVFNILSAGVALFLVVLTANDDSMDLMAKGAIIVVYFGLILFNTWFSFWGDQ